MVLKRVQFELVFRDGLSGLWTYTLQKKTVMKMPINKTLM